METNGANHQSQSHAASSHSKAPCKACTDFKDWAFAQKKVSTTQSAVKNEETKDDTTVRNPTSRECPLDRQELGRNSWSVLHTIAAYYSETPTPTEQTEMQQFVSLFAKFYPCHDCSEDFIESMSKNPPATQSRYNLSKWFCEMHNEVNRKLGKEEFDCANVLKRWRDGWNDGSCG